MLARYHPRLDGDAWSVIDIWTGQVVILVLVAQSGLLQGEATALAEGLNRRAIRTAILQ